MQELCDQNASGTEVAVAEAILPSRKRLTFCMHHAEKNASLVPAGTAWLPLGTIPDGYLAGQFGDMKDVEKEAIRQPVHDAGTAFDNNIQMLGDTGILDWPPDDGLAGV